MIATPSLPELRAALAAAEDRKYGISMSDDFCYSNGTIQPVIEEIRRLRAEIRKMEGRA